MNIYFYPKKSKRGSSTIYVKVIIDDITTEISTGLKVDPETWDKDNDIMEYLHNTRKKIIQIHNTLVSENAVVTSQRIKDAYVTRHVESHTLVAELNSMIERIKTEVKIGNRSKASVQKHQVFLRHVIGFLATKHLTDVTFDQVTVAFLQELETFIKNSGCAHNTTKKHLDIMRKLYRYAKANNWTDQDPFYFYKISERPVKKEPLDEHEIRVLLQREFIPRLSNIRDVFMVQCFTGMSYSDIKRFDKSATYLDSSNTTWIDSSRVKTGVDFDVPLFPKIAELIQKYDFKLPVPSNQKMNAYLKEIGDIAGITKKLTTHLARRTFASLLNEKGVNITAIQRMLGHTKITTTQRYITTNRQFLKDEMEKAQSGLRQLFDENK